MPDEHNPPLGSNRQPGEDHPLNHQVRQLFQDDTILERPRLAFVRVTDDILRFRGLTTNQFWLITHEPWKQIMVDRAQALAGDGSLHTGFGG